MSFKFKIQHKDKKTKARVGRIETTHGVVETPAFVPVGTQATVKGLTPDDLKEIGVQLLFGNTYHLHLRPGETAVKEFGGLAKFMSWNGPTITDSGGFQVFSLAKNESAGRLPHVADDVRQPQSKHVIFVPSLLSERRSPEENISSEIKTGSAFSSSASGQPSNAKKAMKVLRGPTFSSLENGYAPALEDEPALVKITNDGVTFRSHIDGSLHEFTPEESIRIQKKLGADIILAFDECAPHPSTYEYTKEAMERTHEWALRCLKAHSSSPSEEPSSLPRHLGGGSPEPVEGHDSSEVDKQALYGIVQGGVYEDLRKDSAKFIGSLPFDGIAIGGVSVGESKKQMRDVLDWVVPLLSEEKPRHLLGIGEIDDIFDAVSFGMDTFDCVIPTRFGRYGIVFASPPEGSAEQKFRITISKSIYAKDKGPLSKDCKCYVCQNFTRGYINHLFKVSELLAYRLASYHNMYFVVNLVKQIREAILEGRLIELKEKWLSG